MQENGRLIGLGLALIDSKIRYPGVSLPMKNENLPRFLDEQKNIEMQPGGTIPNTLTAYLSFPKNRLVKLFCCIGEDKRGDLFAEYSKPALGIPQRNKFEPTGVWVTIKDKNNKTLDGGGYYGAGKTAIVPQSELREEKNNFFITDIYTCKISHLLDHAETTLSHIKKEGGLFILSLGGTGSLRADRGKLSQILTSFGAEPSIVFANYNEITYLFGSNNFSEILTTAFPNTRILVVTLGKEGSIVRFDGQVKHFPAFHVKKIIDEEGAGDCFAGTFLGDLLGTSYKKLTWKEICHSAHVASYASSLVVQSASARLNEKAIKKVLEFSDALYI
ncbi:MAG: PfkB family carbohydrate kinase [Candidatus Roizmanbacteria bacterium]|nr:PfkB family carbohydrate kinase [Candidatus Roizmanbacteria bacterium]